MAAEFDRVGDDYQELIERSIGFSGVEHAFFREAKARRLLDVARRRLGPLDRVRALDVGCGPGLMHPDLAEIGTLEGVDLSSAMLDVAREANPGVRYHLADGSTLPFDDGVFDLTLAVCVLHHVPTPRRDAFMTELRRVMRPGGLAVVFEHNPLNPITRLAVARCDFDDDAVLLGVRETRALIRSAGLEHTETRYILFLPWRGRLVGGVERGLSRVPLGAQYYVGAYA